MPRAHLRDRGRPATRGGVRPCGSGGRRGRDARLSSALRAPSTSPTSSRIRTRSSRSRLSWRVCHARRFSTMAPVPSARAASPRRHRRCRRSCSGPFRVPASSLGSQRSPRAAPLSDPRVGLGGPSPEVYLLLTSPESVPVSWAGDREAGPDEAGRGVACSDAAHVDDGIDISRHVRPFDQPRAQGPSPSGRR